MKHFKIVGFIAFCVMTMSAQAIVLKGDVGNGGGEDDQSSGGIGIAYQFTEQRLRMFNQPEIFIRTSDGRYGNYLGYGGDMPQSEAGAEFAFYELVRGSTYPITADFTHTEVLSIQSIARSLADSDPSVCDGPFSGGAPHPDDPAREACGTNSLGNDADSKSSSASSSRESVQVSGVTDPDRVVRVTTDYLAGGGVPMQQGRFFAAPDVRVQVASNARNDGEAMRVSDLGISAGFRVWDDSFQEELDGNGEALDQVENASLLNLNLRQVQVDWNAVAGGAGRIEDLGGQVELTMRLRLLRTGIATDTYLVIQTMQATYVPNPGDNPRNTYNEDTAPSVMMPSGGAGAFSGSIGLYSEDSSHPIWAYVDESVDGDPINDPNGKYAQFNPFSMDSLYIEPVLGMLVWVERDPQGRGIVYSTHRARSDFSCHPPNKPNAPMATIVPIVTSRSDSANYLGNSEVPNGIFIRVYAPGQDGICPALVQEDDPDIIVVDGPDDETGGDQGGGDLDSDDDSIHDSADNCPLTPNPSQEDFDGDGVGDVCDNDRDGDGITNGVDNCPFIPNPSQGDLDGDGLGDACDSFQDSDGDGIEDANDNCPFVANANQADQDGDGIGDVCDSDNDNDGIPDGSDNCPAVNNPSQADDDGDGIGNVCDNLNDSDGDGVADDIDNCPSTPNANQADDDGDGIGNACDNDADNDGVPNGQDNCVTVHNPGQEDSDGDGIGDVCDNFNDGDGDGNSDGNDNCPLIPNPGQDDLDGDGIGDVCDDDMDGDGVPNNGDNCEAVANPGQEDVDQDGIGDVCDSNNSTDPFDYSCTEPPGFAITPETPGALSSGVLRGTSGDDFIVGGPEVRTIFPLDGRDKICANYGWDSSGNDNQIVLGRGSKYVYARTPTNDNLRIDEKRNPEYVNNPGGTRNYIYAYRPPNGSATSLGVGIGLDSTESGGAEGFEFTYCEMEWYEPDVVIYEGEGANFAYSNMGCADGSYAEVVGDFMNPDVEDSGGIISIRELSADAKFSVVMGERLNSYLMLPMQSSIDGTLQRSWNIHGRVEALLRNNFLDGTKASAPGLALYSGLVYTSTESTIRFTNTTGSNANGERGHFVACDGDEDPNIGLRYGGISPGGGLAFIQWDNASSNFVDYGEDCGTPSAGTYLITRPNPATFLGY